MVRMRSPVQIWLSAPRRTTSIADVVFLRCTQIGCCATSAWAVICARLVKGRWLFVGLACCHLHGANLVSRFFCVIRKLVAAQPLRGCGLRSTHSSASVWFVSLGHHLHGARLDVVFLRFDINKAQTGCCATSAWAVLCARLVKGRWLFVGFVGCYSERKCGIPWKGTILKPAGGGVKFTPFLTEFPPFPFPLLLCNKESTESLKAGTLSVSQCRSFF